MDTGSQGPHVSHEGPVTLKNRFADLTPYIPDDLVSGGGFRLLGGGRQLSLQIDKMNHRSSILPNLKICPIAAKVGHHLTVRGSLNGRIFKD